MTICFATKYNEKTILAFCDSLRISKNGISKDSEKFMEIKKWNYLFLFYGDYPDEPRKIIGKYHVSNHDPGLKDLCCGIGTHFAEYDDREIGILGCGFEDNISKIYEIKCNISGVKLKIDEGPMGGFFPRKILEYFDMNGVNKQLRDFLRRDFEVCRDLIRDILIEAIRYENKESDSPKTGGEWLYSFTLSLGNEMEMKKFVIT